ncbi:hypothetical protein ZWY2020_029260 [Hordeum vulgare]|nr:hypothetical protein ZWY2020_029260 [Hordeum vulgare]
MARRGFVLEIGRIIRAPPPVYHYAYAYAPYHLLLLSSPISPASQASERGKKEKEKRLPTPHTPAVSSISSSCCSSPSAPPGPRRTASGSDRGSSPLPPPPPPPSPRRQIRGSAPRIRRPATRAARPEPFSSALVWSDPETSFL